MIAIFSVLGLMTSVVGALPARDFEQDPILASSALPESATLSNASEYRPVVFWHGLGDSFDSAGMISAMESLKVMYPDIYTHSVYVDLENDSQKSVFGEINGQIEEVCRQLNNISELAAGFDGVGFSQGGLFLRAYAERCNNPPLRSLISFGSPHNGISDLPKCSDMICRQRNALLKSRIYSEWAQTHVISATYYRDPHDYETYLNHSVFLADVNNERSSKNTTYAANLAHLERLVMIMFADDETVVPKESAWFQEVDDETGEVTPLERRPLYTEDWIGLKQIPNISYVELQGVHMQISEQDLLKVYENYLGNKA